MSRDPYKIQKTEEHESYGIIGISRSYGTPQSLFGSSIKHGNFITLTLKTCKKSRDYQKDHYFGLKSLAEITISTSQFAELITSLNMGDGVPCTIRYILGDEKRRENPPDISFQKQATDDLKEEIKHLGDNLNELQEKANTVLKKKGNILKKEKEELLRTIEVVKMELESNLPFIHECFNEAVDKTVTEAKAEVDATLQAFNEQTGKNAIASGIELNLLGN